MSPLLVACTALQIAAVDPVLVVSDPAVLRALEDRGASFGERAFALPVKTRIAGELAKTPEWRSISSSIRRDLQEVARADRKSGVGMRYVHRLFDARWLESAATRFELTGVVNRLDRRAFAPASAPGGCGEVRFIYRLAYSAGKGPARIDSRLPMTANVVYHLEPGSKDRCKSAAARFVPAEVNVSDPAAFADWLMSNSGPLGAARLKSVELNLQSVRWPATIRPELGGHAEYFLRVFRPGENRQFIEASLENTPDAEKIAENPALKRALAAWIRSPENLEAIELGIAVLPEQFLARKSTSVAPRGLARLANRPFRRIFSPDEFRDLELSRFETVKTPAALLRRLDAMTCAGCHQSRAVAGFHFLGTDPPEREVDAIAVPISAHLAGELHRRKTYLARVIAGEETRELRLSPEREGSSGELGAHCGLGDPGFAAWTCAADLECVAIDEPEVGACHGPKGRAAVGDPCEVGRVSADANPHRDRLRLTGERTCGPSSICEATAVGFPGGMCAAECGGDDPGTACGAIAILTPFNECLARGEPFATCVREHTRPAGLRRCDRDRPCRDDYICTKASGADAVCIPPYFLFQMRVDGHRL